MGNCQICAQSNIIYRGTTPTFIIILPEDFDGALIEEAYLTFTQAGKTVIEKSIEDMDFDPEEANVLLFTLDQNDTLAFRSSNLEYQLRFLIEGLAYATQIWNIEVGRILKDGAIGKQ